MTALAWLIPIALLLGGLGLGAFLWSLRSGQFDDLEGAGYRILEDDPQDAAQDVLRRKPGGGNPGATPGGDAPRAE
jgi:cbb3-type cytochrome oxidase maturation protein